ncbi:ABC transporter ATP-binding protein [Clostridium sp. WILCCON 0269]|uniref:ABC transporter ATP-binding protein n=1 Tax=Candidatus Clostridium eludens TaxID=3381663 RepID=A0ABW8SL70_9CLOT
MIEVINLTKNYGNIKAVNNLNFEVKKGEIVGFLGPNGAGKSTTMNIITGYMSSTGGTVKVCGFDILEEPIEVKKRIGYLPEQTPLYTNMTVIEFLNFISDLKLVEKKQKKKHLEEIIKKVNLIQVKDRLIGNLSNGYKHRVGLAQALIGDPEILILDEPTTGLDPAQIIEIRKLIVDLGKEHTVILSSHILPEVSAVCQKVIIINKGEIVAVDTPDNLSKRFINYSKFHITMAGDKKLIEEKLSGIDDIKSIQVDEEKEDNVISYIIETSKDKDVRKTLFYVMANAGLPILESKSLDTSLEDIFVQLVTDEKEVK